MPDLSTLRDLQRRLREATGPDRELDAAIFDAFGLSRVRVYQEPGAGPYEMRMTIPDCLALVSALIAIEEGKGTQ